MAAQQISHTTPLRTGGTMLAFAFSALAAFLGTPMGIIVIAIVALMAIDLLLNVRDEGKAFAAVLRAIAAGVVPQGLETLGRGIYDPHTFLLIGLTVALAVLLTSVVPQVLGILNLWIGKSLPPQEQAATEAILKADIEAEVAKLHELIKNLQNTTLARDQAVPPPNTPKSAG